MLYQYSPLKKMGKGPGGKQPVPSLPRPVPARGAHLRRCASARMCLPSSCGCVWKCGALLAAKHVQPRAFAAPSMKFSKAALEVDPSCSKAAAATMTEKEASRVASG